MKTQTVVYYALSIAAIIIIIIATRSVHGTRITDKSITTETASCDAILQATVDNVLKTKTQTVYNVSLQDYYGEKYSVRWTEAEYNKYLTASANAIDTECYELSVSDNKMGSTTFYRYKVLGGKPFDKTDVEAAQEGLVLAESAHKTVAHETVMQYDGYTSDIEGKRKW